MKLMSETVRPCSWDW